MDEEMLFELKNVCNALDADLGDVLNFLKLRGYAMQRKGEWFATPMGVEYNYLKNELWPKEEYFYPIHFFVTFQGFCKLKKTFALVDISDLEKQRLNAICAEAEKKARPNKFIGLDE